MFFGLTNSPATFQAMMNHIFQEEIREGWLVVYMDDLLIATKDDTTFHKQCIQRVLQKLLDHDLYLKLSKCEFHKQHIEYLGVVLEHGQVQMDPTKVKGVADWNRPQNAKDVRSFLGFMGFYRYFIKDYSKIACPLIDLTKKNLRFDWTEKQQTAFERLKTLMCAKPVLRQPDYTKRSLYPQTHQDTEWSSPGPGRTTGPQDEQTSHEPSRILLVDVHTYRAKLRCL
jgi:hypothetical protein